MFLNHSCAYKRPGDFLYMKISNTGSGLASLKWSLKAKLFHRDLGSDVMVSGPQTTLCNKVTQFGFCHYDLKGGFCCLFCYYLGKGGSGTSGIPKTTALSFSCFSLLFLLSLFSTFYLQSLSKTNVNR